MTKEALTLALEAYIKAGAGNSTDFVLQSEAYDLAVEALAQPEQEPHEQEQSDCSMCDEGCCTGRTGCAALYESKP